MRYLLFFAVNVLILPFFCTAQIAQNLGTRINALCHEGYPMISADGQTLYFTRLGHEENIGEAALEDIWMAGLLSNNNWTAPVNLSPPINTRNPNIIVGISVDGNQLFVKNKEEKNNSSIVAMSRKSQSRSWLSPRPIVLGEWRSRSFSENYTVNAYANVAICAFDAPLTAFGKHNGKDLYVSFRDVATDAWSTPLPLGKDINSERDEVFGFLAPDNKTLYFNRKQNNLNSIYFSRRLDDSWKSWTEPQVVKTGGVTLSDETACSVSARGDFLYFNALQQEENTHDIYRIELPVEQAPLAMMLVQGGVQQEVAPPYRLQVEDAKTGDKKWLSLEPQQPFKYLLPRKHDLLLWLEVQEGYAETVVLNATGVLSNVLDDDAQVSAHDMDPEIERLELKIAESERGIQRAEARRAFEQERVWAMTIRMPPQMKKVSPRSEFIAATGSKTAQPAPSKDAELERYRSKYRDILSQSESNATNAQARNSTSGDLELDKWRDRFNASSAEPLQQEQMRDSVTHEEVLEVLQEMKMLWSAELQLESLEDVYNSLEGELSEVARRYLAGVIREKRRALRDNIAEWYQLNGAILPAKLTDDFYKQLNLVWKTTVRDAQRLALKYDIQYKILKLVKEKQESERAQRQRAKENAYIQPSFEEKGGSENMLDSLFHKGYLQQEVLLKVYPAEAESIFLLNGVFFESNSSVLKPESRWELERLVIFLQQYPHLNAEIRAHTHGHCSQHTADVLTQSRAQAIVAYLQSHRIDAKRLEAVGVGKSEPLFSNDSPHGRLQNQRIEVRLKK